MAEEEEVPEEVAAPAEEAEDIPPEAEAEPEPEPEAPPETHEEPKPDREATPEPPQTKQDALSMEFLYYGSILKVVAPTISTETDREMATPWIKKLFRPEYQTSKLKDKRNRYLVCLTINLFNDEIDGVFQRKPPEKALVDLNSVYYEPSPAAQWELAKMWQESLLALPDDFRMMECIVHGSKEECENDHKLDKILDQEFQFLLYVARPYAALLPPEDKTRTAAWLQTLCTIHGKACSSMKAIRNDYLMALMGYLHDLRVAGPFVEYPPNKLEPLAEAARRAAKVSPVTDPTGHDATQFLLDQPVPDDGAFCYVALTGDLIASNMQ